MNFYSLGYNTVKTNFLSSLRFHFRPHCRSIIKWFEGYMLIMKLYPVMYSSSRHISLNYSSFFLRLHVDYEIVIIIVDLSRIQLPCYVLVLETYFIELLVFLLTVVILFVSFPGLGKNIAFRVNIKHVYRWHSIANGFRYDGKFVRFNSKERTCCTVSQYGQQCHEDCVS